MSALAARGMLDFSLEDGERVEPFFVTKKNGELRLVVDCRRSNCHFTEAGGVSLCTGEGLSAIELGTDEDIFVGGADLSDAFYHMGLPKPLRKYFTVRPARAASVGCTEIGGRAVAAHEKVYPRLAVIPMGWSWASWMRQKIHERIVEAAGSEPKLRITDKTCAPDLSQPCHTQYVDNYIAISTNRDNVKNSVSSAITALESGAGVVGALLGALVAMLGAGLVLLPREMIEQDWRVVGRFEWRKKGESIPVLEARATLYGYSAGALVQVLPTAPPGSVGPKRRKVSQRASRAAARRPTAARLPGMTVLEAASIKPRTRDRYQEIFADFLVWANGRRLTTEDLVDQAIAEWLGDLYLGGEDLSAGSRAYAAVTFFAGLNKASGALMPRSRRALQGFRKLAPPRSRLPMPYMVAAMAVMELLGRQRYQSALAVLLIFELCLRPGEAFHIRAVDLAPPVARVSGAPHWCVTLHAAETERESKTGEFDESLSLDLSRQSFIGPALDLMLKHQLGADWRRAEQRHVGSGLHLAAPLFTVTLDEVTRDFKGAVETLGVDTALGAAHMYMLRHGGASHDYASGCRRLEDARRRGRWRSWSSVRRYEKGSRLGQVVHKLGPVLQAHGKLCVELLSERVFVEAFSGSGHLSEAISRVGVTALLWDTSLGESCDLRCKRNRLLLLGWVRAGLVAGAHGIAVVTADFCQGGVPWKKSATFLCYDLDLAELEAARCAGSKRGICKRAGLPHQQLQGKDQTGNFYTKLAEPCPKKLCKDIADAYCKTWAKCLGESFGRFMQ
ncbi:unnamed protein product [Prorocentrum cordatum]|uniref:Uncharacterized protein n=1 Tax=Prorocentrum cordatum TaxID=2364126 RepID=A0ABN9VGJ1_9DINO|nr:unnamed protein product [Polarella glacialis]